jgi:ABC-2 type transport system permease protein
MKKYLLMLFGEFKVGLILQRRYFIDFIASIINLLLFLIFIQFGIHSLSDVPFKSIDSQLSSLIIGFFVFSVVSIAIGSISNYIMDGAKSGILEQTMLTPFGVGRIFLIRALFSNSLGLVTFFIVIPISMVICNHWFSINILNCFILLIPLWMASCGVGFIIGAFTLILKRVQSFINLIQFLVLSLIILPSYPFSVFSLFPVAPEANIFIKVVAKRLYIPVSWIIYIYGHSLITLFIGMTIFKICEFYTRKKGLLGQY